MSAASHRRHAPVLADISDVVPFHSAEEAWFWTMAGRSARGAGARSVAGLGAKPRPCEPDDVIPLMHERILRIYGDRQVPPDPRHPGDRSAHKLWREALDRLDWPLRMKGIVA